MSICLYRQRQAGFKRGPRQPTRAEPLPTFPIPLSCLCSTSVPPHPPPPFALAGPVATSRWTKRTRTSRCSEKEQAAQATAGVSASAACVRACTERAPREPLCGQGATPLPSAVGFRSGSGRTRPGRLNETNRPVAGPYVHTIHMDNITCKYGDRWIYGWTDGWMDRWMDR